MTTPSPSLAPLLLAALAAVAVLVRPGHRRDTARAGDGPGRSDAGGPGGFDAAADPARASRPRAARGQAPLHHSLRSRLRLLGGGRRAVATALDAQELEVVDTIAAALEGGLPVNRAVVLALERARPTASGDRADWDIVVRAALEGEPLAPAWERLARRTGTPTVGAVARSWQVAARSGAPLAEALRVSARTARERRRLEDAVETASAGARATATVLTLLPLAGIALAAVLGVHPAALYATPVAGACLAAGAVLLLLGRVLVRRLIADVLEDAR